MVTSFSCGLRTWVSRNLTDLATEDLVQQGYLDPFALICLKNQRGYEKASKGNILIPGIKQSKKILFLLYLKHLPIGSSLTL